MKYLPLIWKNVWRRKSRPRSRCSYQARLQQVPGVELATHQTWFNGIYQDPSNFFANIAVEPEPFLQIYPEFVLAPEQVEAWLADRQGVIARRFDGMFANSSAETKTTTEKGFVESFATQVGDIGAIMIAISSTVLFMFGLVAASTMAQSGRERTSELAVLKTLGFEDRAILALVLAESLAIALAGGLLGLGLAWLIVQGGDPTGGLLPIFILPARDLALGVGLMVAMGLIAGAMPALGAMRLRITDALRRN